MVSSGLVVAGAVTDPLRDMAVALPPWGRENTHSSQQGTSVFNSVPFVCRVLVCRQVRRKELEFCFFLNFENIGETLALWKPRDPQDKRDSYVPCTRSWCSDCCFAKKVCVNRLIAAASTSRLLVLCAEISVP